MAQVVLADHLARAGIDAIVTSTGVSDEEWGNPIDRRAARVLTDAGYQIPAHRARQITLDDLTQTDLILAMTRSHRAAIDRLAARAGLTPPVRLLREFDPTTAGAPSSSLDVPDPWYGTMADFTHTLAQIEAAAPGVVAWAERFQRGDNPPLG
jgi:protein-tyrosine phosphatase